jgi:hypothetical protein
MPVEVAPNRIELSSLLGGYAPDPEEGSLQPDQTPDVTNLLPDVNSGALELRKGFSRLSAGRASALTDTHYLRHLNYYEFISSGSRKRYLIAIMTSGTDASANNIQVWAYDLANNTFSRIDTAGRSWAKAKTEHWYAIVEGTYYGGTRGEEIYSWDGTTWDANPTTPSVRTWVDDKGDSAGDPDDFYAKDYAFKKGQKVLYSSKYYSTLRGIRYDTWEASEKYIKGKRVSRKVDHGTYTYWRSFECTKEHTSSAANRPGDGTDTSASREAWRNIRLKNIKDEDSEITRDWAYMPLPGKGVVGVYHGFRLWVRHDDSDNWARLQYSAPAKPEKDSLISDLDWRPTDWAPVDDDQGDGGGWFTVPFAKGDAIRALHSYGQYLLIFGRWESFVLAGTNEQSWNLRPLGKIGAIGPQSVTEHDGLVYFWSPEGTLNVTDGTSWQEVPGMDKVREHIKDRTDQLMVGADSFNWHPVLQSYGAFIWMALPDNDGTDETLVYHPSTESFWKLDIPILDMAVGEKGRAQRMWFSTAITLAGSTQTPTIFEYKDDPGNETYTDDDWAGGSSTLTSDIAYSWRSSWFRFGTTRQERRLRRLWALVTGEAAHSMTIIAYRNFAISTLTTVARTLTGQATQEAEYVEGKVGQTKAGYAFGVKLSGSANAQLAIHGVGLDTEPIRTRFHKNT